MFCFASLRHIGFPQAPPIDRPCFAGFQVSTKRSVVATRVDAAEAVEVRVTAQKRTISRFRARAQKWRTENGVRAGLGRAEEGLAPV